MTGQLYTDQEAPAHLRGTAQGFLTFLTYGVGMFIGSLLSGVALDFFTSTKGGVVTHNWTAFWLGCSGGALVILRVGGGVLPDTRPDRDENSVRRSVQT